VSARPLATAAAASLAAGTCRVRLTRFTDPPPAPGIDLTFVEEVEGMRALMADHHRPGRTTVHGSSDPDATGRSPHDPLWIFEILRTATGPVGPFRVRPSRDEAAIQGEASSQSCYAAARATWRLCRELCSRRREWKAQHA